MVTKEEIARVALQAVAIAKANQSINAEPVRLAPVDSYNDTWNTPVVKNPFDMPLQPRLDLLLQIHEEALKVPGASVVSASMQFVSEQKYFASSADGEGPLKGAAQRLVAAPPERTPLKSRWRAR